MGFGRMGRNIFRALHGRDDIEIVAINDIADPKAMVYLLRFDTLHGRFKEPVTYLDGYLYAGGRRIPWLQQAEPGAVPWYDFGADVVIEATGRYRTRSALQKHLDAGADRVILTVPPRETAGPIGREHRLISCGSSTLNCVAVMLKVLERAFGIEEAFFTSVHAYTTEQSLIDVPNSVYLRLSRAAVENIVPLSSWTVSAIPKLFPKLEGRFGGAKLNVPVPDVSCADLVTMLGQEVEPRDVNEIFRSASGSTMRAVLDFTEEPIVSSDVIASDYSCTFDSQATMVTAGRMVKTLGWYEQGGGLADRIVEVIEELAPRR
jgi:glyceraldehyde 3-phosphate dehydrogenase